MVVQIAENNYLKTLFKGQGGRCRGRENIGLFMEKHFHNQIRRF